MARTATEVEVVTTFVALLRRVPTAGELVPVAGRSSAASASLVSGLLGSGEYAARFD